jgi:formiminoglutamase
MYNIIGTGFSAYPSLFDPKRFYKRKAAPILSLSPSPSHSVIYPHAAIVSNYYNISHTQYLILKAMTYNDIAHYLVDVSYAGIKEKLYNKEQFGFTLSKHIEDVEEAINEAQVVLLGCGERRGQTANKVNSMAADIVREQLYELYHWHSDQKIIDLGNIMQGSTLADTRRALSDVLTYLQAINKTVVLIGGSHDLTMQQYEAFKRNEKLIDATVLDMVIDLKDEEEVKHDNFLFELLTSTPNYVRNFNLQGYQSFATNPVVLQMLDNLHFECMRLGKLQDDLGQIDPILRRSNLCSIDINCIKHADAPANVHGSPNGLSGAEACALTEFAGMSDKCTSIGFFGYNEEEDLHAMTAKQISHMIWYFINGRYFGSKEPSPVHEPEQFDRYTVLFDDAGTDIPHQELVFVRSIQSNRWWMQLPNKSFYPCHYNDYNQAKSGHLSNALHKELVREI